MSDSLDTIPCPHLEAGVVLEVGGVQGGRHVLPAEAAVHVVGVARPGPGQLLQLHAGHHGLAAACTGDGDIQD